MKGREIREDSVLPYLFLIGRQVLLHKNNLFGKCLDQLPVRSLVPEQVTLAALMATARRSRSCRVNPAAWP